MHHEKKEVRMNIKKAIIAIAALIFCGSAAAQFKPRQDAFPPVKENNDSKAVNMASTPAEMANWDRYPTYSTYVSMMQQWAADYPTLCRLDTIGTSVNGRLILSMEITANRSTDTLPEFFYSSTIHGDEVTGYVMMLRLAIDPHSSFLRFRFLRYNNTRYCGSWQVKTQHFGLLCGFFCKVLKRLLQRIC